MKGKVFLGTLFLWAAMCAPLFAEDLETDFTGQGGERLIEHGDFILQGTVLVQYRGDAEYVTIPEGLGITEIGYDVFSESKIISISIPEGVERIDRSFVDCYNLSTVDLPSTLLSIESYAFSDCTSLINITIPERLSSIEEWTFHGCRSLTGITIPENITAIGSHAFRDCSGLTRITIPANVVSIGDYAFSGCIGLINIKVDEENKHYSSPGGILFNKGMTELLVYPAGRQENTYTIPEGITSIGHGAFFGCGNLTGINIPTSVRSIGASAFSGCHRLTDIIIPENVTSIGGMAFWACHNLESISIPEGVTSIMSYTFFGCRSLRRVVISKRTKINAYAFDDDTFIRYHNEEDSGYRYKTATNGLEIPKPSSFTDRNTPITPNKTPNHDFSQILKNINKNIMIIAACILVGVTGILIFIKLRKTRAKRKGADDAQ